MGHIPRVTACVGATATTSNGRARDGRATASSARVRGRTPMARRRDVASARWCEVPFAHAVTVVVGDEMASATASRARGGSRGEDEARARSGAMASRGTDGTVEGGDESFDVERWAWTGARDGGIVRWALDKGAARRAGSAGAANYCSGHDDAVVRFVKASRAMVSVDAAGAMCAWDRRTGRCLHKRATPRGEVRAVCETAVECGEEGTEGVALIVGVESRGEQCSVVDPLGSGSVSLGIPQDFGIVAEIFVDASGTLSVRSVDGQTHSWPKVDALVTHESVHPPNRNTSAFDLTGWGSITKVTSELISETNASENFNHEVDTPFGRVHVRGDEANCVLSVNDCSFSLSDRWNSTPGLVVTSCAPAKGGAYAPESYIYGYSDGTICSCPLYGSSTTSAKFSGHDGAVLSLLDWVDGQNENFLISGGKDGTVRAWDYRVSKNVAILRHHQGPVRWILSAPKSAREVSWNNIFITIGDDGVLGLVSAETWAVNFIMPGNGVAVKELVWNAPRGALAVLSKDGSLHVWDILTGVLERHLIGAAAGVMLNSLREGSFHILLHGAVGLAQRQWRFTRKRLRPLTWRCMQANIFGLTVHTDALLEPVRAGLPSHGVKRRISNLLPSATSPIAKTFVDEEVRALHLLLGTLLNSNDSIVTDDVLAIFFAENYRSSSVSLHSCEGAATFNLPGVRGSKDVNVDREIRILTIAVIIRIIQVSESLSISSYCALINAIEESMGQVDDTDLVFFAGSCMSPVECIRQASRRLLSVSVKKSLPTTFKSLAPTNLFGCEQYKRWDRLASGEFMQGLLGLIISSVVCFIPNKGVHDSWKIAVSNSLLEALSLPDKNVVFTAASLLTEGIKLANWSSCLSDPNKSLEEVFTLCSTTMSSATSPTESMIAREALSDLLSAFTLVSPPFFFSHMNNRFRTLDPDHPAHVLALMALIRVAQTHVKTLQTHAVYMMETIMLALNPSNLILRKNCQQTVYVLLTELGKSSSMAFHRETQRFVTAIHGAVKNGTVMTVYDLHSATKWRNLEDSHTDSYDRSSETSSADWSDPLSLLSPEKHVKHSSNVLVNHAGSGLATDSGQLSVKAVSFDAEGNQVAAYLDKLSFVYVWDLTTSWRHTFARGTLPLGTSHYMPCVPSEAPLDDVTLGGSGESSIECSLKFVTSRQIHLVHGEVDMVFSFV